MRVGIDATWAGVVGTGTASYTQGLVSALVRRRDHEYILYFQPGDERRNVLWNIQAPCVTRRVVGGRGQLGRTLGSLTRQARLDGLDVYHSPGFFLPLWPGPRVVTFHDVNMFLQWDKWWRPGMRASWLALCAQTVLASRLASRILADSYQAALAIRRTLLLPPERVTVLYPGVDDSFFQPSPAGEARGIRADEELDEYALFVGVLSPQKNLEGVIRAFALLSETDLKLAIVGREDGAYWKQVILPLINRLGLRGRVRRLGTVPSGALPGLYAGARLLLFPSFAEGFGLPPLEAMAVGTPVVASDRSSLPEVLGDAAILVDPTDVAALARAAQHILTDPELSRALVARGKDRASRFRWSAAADAALSIYADVA